MTSFEEIKGYASSAYNSASEKLSSAYNVVQEATSAAAAVALEFLANCLKSFSGAIETDKFYLGTMTTKLKGAVSFVKGKFTPAEAEKSEKI